MNRTPNTSGISRYWKDGDDRRRLAKLLSLWYGDDPAGRNAVDAFLDAFLRLIRTRRRTSIVGFGVFEWKPWKARIPTGKTVETWRLVFRLARDKRGRKWK